MKPVLRFSFFVLWIFIVNSCSSKKAFVARAPEERTEKQEVHSEVSEVRIPVELSVAGIQTSINNQLKGILYETKGLKANENITLDLKVSKLSDILFDVRGDEVYYTVPLRLWTNTFFKASLMGIPVEDSKEMECAIELSFKSKVSVDSLWKVQTLTSIEKYNWLQKPVLSVAGVELPFGWLADFILKNQKEVIVKSLDNLVKDQLSIKPYIEEAWNKIQQPLLVRENPSIWLIIKPIRAFMAPFEGKTGKLTSSVGVTAYVESRLGTKPDLQKTLLPPLLFSKGGPDEFRISLTGDVTYDQVRDMVRDNVKGHAFDFQDGKYKVKVMDIDVYPVGDMLAVKTTLTGSLNGIVYLKGRLFYDSTTKTLRLTQTQFDLHTKNKLYKTASWLIHGTLEKKIEKSLSYPLYDQLKSGEELIRQALTQNRVAPHIVINGKLSHLSPKDIILTPSGIKAIVTARGNLQVLVDGF